MLRKAQRSCRSTTAVGLRAVVIIENSISEEEARKERFATRERFFTCLVSTGRCWQALG